MRTRNYPLNDDEVRQLEDLIRHAKRADVVKRATAVRLLYLEQDSLAVSRMLLVTSTSVRNWYTRFRAEGASGLVNRPRSGRPPEVTSEYWQAIEAALASEPATWEYPFTIWTLDRLRDHAERQTGIHLNAQYLSELLKKRGYVYRQPKHDLAVHQDAAAKAEAAILIEQLKKTPKTGSLSCSLWTKVP
jgi:transposase